MSLKSIKKAGIGKVGVLALLIIGLPNFILTAIVQPHELKSQHIERSFTRGHADGVGAETTRQVRKELALVAASN